MKVLQLTLVYFGSIPGAVLDPSLRPTGTRSRTELFEVFVDFPADFRRERDADAAPVLSIVIVGFTAVILDMELKEKLQ